MKRHKLYLTSILLIAILFSACSIKRTYPYDRFGGGISVKKPMHNSTNAITEKIQQPTSEKSSPSIGENVASRLNISEKQQQKIKNMVQDVPEVKVAKKTVNTMQQMNQKIKTRVYRKEIPVILKTAAMLFMVAASLMTLGLLFIGIFGFRYKNETTGGLIGVVMFLMGIILGIIAFLMALIGGISMLFSAQFKNTSTNLAKASPKEPM